MNVVRALSLVLVLGLVGACTATWTCWGGCCSDCTWTVCTGWWCYDPCWGYGDCYWSTLDPDPFAPAPEEVW